jgi:1,4-alpha-glucan branching enzyme
MKSKKTTKTTKDSFNSGTNYQCYKLLGSHIKKINGVQGVKFSLWAPNAVRVNIKGDFNGWNGENHAMKLNKKTGIWQLFIPEAKEKQGYLYEVYIEENSCPVEKADPFAFFSKVRPDKASSIYRVAGYNWKDKNWMEKRKNKNPYSSPMNIYEVHLGSWKTHEDGTFYS